MMKSRTEVKKRTRIRKKLQRLAAAMLAVVMSITCVNASALSLAPGVYSDVPDNAWYASAVRYCGETGMMNGTGDDTFAPYGKATRAMMVQVLYNMTEQKDLIDGFAYQGQWLGFADVNLERWYSEATVWAYKSGIVEGTGENNFSPNRPVTRQDMAVLLYRYALRTGNDTAAKDTGDKRLLEASSYARDALQWALEKGILKGDADGSLRPRDTATRAEMAQVLKNSAEILKKRVVSPYARVTEEAKKLGFTDENYPRVDGSTSTLNLVQGAFSHLHESWNESAYPETPSRTVPSYEKLIKNEADIILVPYASEDVLAQAKAAGVELEFHKLALEALVFVTPKENTATNITEAQALSIYRDYSIKNWNNLGGPDKELVPLCRNAASGSQSQMDNLILKGQPMHPDIEKNYILTTMDGMLMQTALFHKDNGEQKGRDCYALGYTLFAYLNNFDSDSFNKDSLKMLSYNGVAPTEASLKDGSYPLVDGYYAVLRKDTPADAPARKLLSWYQSKAGSDVILSNGFLPAA